MKIEFFMPLGHTTANAQLQDALLQRFGGFTAYPGTGAWLSAEKCAVVEPVEVLTVYAQDEHKVIDFLQEQAKRYGYAAKQECVLFVVDGKTNFVYTDLALLVA